MSRRRLSSNYTCVDGREMRHDPQTDDPYLQTDVGACPDCDGEGCAFVEIPTRQPDVDLAAWRLEVDRQIAEAFRIPVIRNFPVTVPAGLYLIAVPPP